MGGVHSTKIEFLTAHGFGEEVYREGEGLVCRVSSKA